MEIEEAKQQYYDNGYFIVDDTVDSEMVDRLEAAGRHVVEKTRSGEINLSGQGPKATGIIGLIAPEFGQKAFAEYQSSEPILRYVNGFIGTNLRMGLSVLWSCENMKYDCGWHRDIGVPRDATISREEEQEVMDEPLKSFKWQTALLDDPCLWVVPGSHRRTRTDIEMEVLNNDRKADLPGEKNVLLKRGQTVFWESRLMHRGRGPEGFERRLSLAGSFAQYRPDEEVDELHEQFHWQLEDSVRDYLPEKMVPYYDRWRKPYQN